MLNNEMDDFAIPNRESSYGMPPSPANMLAPGMQPLSSMVPSIVLNNNGAVDLVLGAAGGTKITTQVAVVRFPVLLYQWFGINAFAFNSFNASIGFFVIENIFFMYLFVDGDEHNPRRQFAARCHAPTARPSPADAYGTGI